MSFLQEQEAREYDEAMSQFSNYPQLVVHNYGREGMHPDRDICICQGSGWWLSPYDTWETCGHHNTGQSDPESQDETAPNQYATEDEWRASPEYLHLIEWEMQWFVRHAPCTDTLNYSKS